MINRFALSFLCIELDRTRNVRGHRTLYTTYDHTCAEWPYLHVLWVVVFD